MFTEIVATGDFEQVFANHFGITTEALKETLFDELRQFLSP